MNKLLNFIGILLIVACSIAFNALFLYVGWSMLIGILQFDWLPSITYAGWFAILCFFKLVSASKKSKKSIPLNEAFVDADFIMSRITSLINKSFALLLLYIISLI